MLLDLEIQDRFTEANKRFANEAFNRLVAAHQEMGDEFLSVKYRDLVPVAEGTLRASAFAPTDRSGNTVVTRMGYGTVYAAEQHEREDFDHPTGGTHHFVFGAAHSPLNENEERWRENMLAAVMSAWPT